MRVTVLVACLLPLLASQVLGHCQVPCGIYDDERRLDTVAEDIVTVEKAIKQVDALSKEAPPNYNQIVRWINVKEEHADDIAEIVSWYFLQQRVKPLVERGVIPVITGYIAATEGGVTTALGRGGGDYVAAIVGAGLDADEVWIWSDVDGILTADPNIVPQARVLTELSYTEAANLA